MLLLCCCVRSPAWFYERKKGVREGNEAASTRVRLNRWILQLSACLDQLSVPYVLLAACFMPRSSEVAESDTRNLHVCWTRCARACRKLGPSQAGIRYKENTAVETTTYLYSEVVSRLAGPGGKNETVVLAYTRVLSLYSRFGDKLLENREGAFLPYCLHRPYMTCLMRYYIL